MAFTEYIYDLFLSGKKTSGTNIADYFLKNSKKAKIIDKTVDMYNIST